MCLILEHEDIVFRLSVNFYPYFDRACIDLFRLIKVCKLAVLLKLLAGDGTDIHEADRLLADPLAVNIFSCCKIILICLFDLGRELVITFKLDVCEVCKECRVTAVIRPVGIENTDLGNRWNSSLLFEEILNELYVSKAHCKSHGLS